MFLFCKSNRKCWKPEMTRGFITLILVDLIDTDVAAAAAFCLVFRFTVDGLCLVWTDLALMILFFSISAEQMQCTYRV